MKIVLVGAGGHCAACLDVVLASGADAAGVLDPREGASVGGLPWLGDDGWFAGRAAEGFAFLVTVGQTGEAGVRRRLYEGLRTAGRPLATVCSPHAVLARDARVGPGTIVMHHALVNANATVGANCIVNSAALVEHDAVVGDHCHVSTGAILNGGVEVGAGSLIGSGAIVLQGLRIAAGSIVGAGAVITRDIEQGTWVGVPARRIA